MNSVSKVFGSVNRVVSPLVKAGVGSPLLIGGGLIILETTGRKSGVARQVPLAATRMGDKIIVSTVRNKSLWIKNLEAQPRAAIWVCGQRREVTASVNRRDDLSIVTLDLAD